MTTPRKQIIGLIEQGSIPRENIQDALKSAKVLPSEKDWRVFIDHLFLWLGCLSLGVAAIFFIAYNLADIGRFAKFGFMEALIAIAIIGYCKFENSHLIGKISLLLATLFMGALMALYGQTYQTGADPWQLFFNWSLLILPWVIISRFTALWILWITLINLSIILYYQTFRGVIGLMFHSEEALLWIVFFFNTCALFTWEILSKPKGWLSERWGVRLLAVGSGIPITWLCLHAIFDDTTSAVAGFLWLLWGGGLYFVYRKFKPDLFMLAGGCLSGIVVAIVFLSKILLFETGVGGFLFLAMLVIGLGAGAATWLRNIQKELRS